MGCSSAKLGHAQSDVCKMTDQNIMITNSDSVLYLKNIGTEPDDQLMIPNIHRHLDDSHALPHTTPTIFPHRFWYLTRGCCSIKISVTEMCPIISPPAKVCCLFANTNSKTSLLTNERCPTEIIQSKIGCACAFAVLASNHMYTTIRAGQQYLKQFTVKEPPS